MRVSVPFASARDRSGRLSPKRARLRWVQLTLILLAIAAVVVQFMLEALMISTAG